MPVNYGLLQPIQQVAQPMQGSAPGASAPAISNQTSLADETKGFLSAYQAGQQIQGNDQALKIGEQNLQQQTIQTDEMKTKAQIAKDTREAATQGVQGLLQYYDTHDPVGGSVFRKSLADQQQTEANAQKADAEAYGSSIKVRGDFVGIVNQGRNDEEKAQIWQIQRSGMSDSVKKLVPEKYTSQNEQAMMSILSFAQADYLSKHPEAKDKATSTVGKIQQDADRLRSEIANDKKAGIDTTQKEKNLASLETAETTQSQGTNKFQQANVMRDEVNNITKPFREVNDAYGRIQASAKDPSAAGDLALVFNYMKMLDPGSTVREGEFATAQNSAGIPDRIRAMYNKAASGERLAPDTRKDFVGRAGTLYKSQEKGYQQIIDDYSKRAKRAGLNPEDVIVDPRVKGRSPDAQASSPSQEDLEFTAKKYNMTVEQVKAKLAGGK